MTEYIEKNKAIKELYEVYDYEFPTASGGFDEYARMIVPNTIKNMTAADVAPVRHGHWIMKKTSAGASYTVCSHCNTSVKYNDEYGTEVMNLKGANCCPNCGADMRGSNDE